MQTDVFGARTVQIKYFHYLHPSFIKRNGIERQTEDCRTGCRIWWGGGYLAGAQIIFCTLQRFGLLHILEDTACAGCDGRRRRLQRLQMMTALHSVFLDYFATGVNNVLYMVPWGTRLWFRSKILYMRRYDASGIITADKSSVLVFWSSVKRYKWVFSIQLISG